MLLTTIAMIVIVPALCNLMRDQIVSQLKIQMGAETYHRRRHRVIIRLYCFQLMFLPSLDLPDLRLALAIQIAN